MSNWQILMIVSVNMRTALRARQMGDKDENRCGFQNLYHDGTGRK